MNINRKAIIVYGIYYDFNEQRLLSGGLQTYISNLLPILSEFGYKCYIYQFDENRESKKIELDNCCIQTVPESEKRGKRNTKIVLDYIANVLDKERDLLIFADHILTDENNAGHSLSIQHGIHWDIPKRSSRKDWRMFLSKARFSYLEHKHMKCVNKVVCVDYNFLNWYRTQVDVPEKNITVIPNFTQISTVNVKPKDVLNIIFARRFVPHRGTHIFGEAIDRILDKYDFVNVTVAGEGPDEEYLHSVLDKWGERVFFTRYNSEESLEIHADKHIALVPTVGSEGTSLSLLEAMSAQCAVICTDVGGMTNIIINGYNGKMITAGNVDELYSAIQELIDNPKEMEKMAMAGYETVKTAFSYERWKTQWCEVIKNI